MKTTLMPSTNPLHQITTNNACPLRITAAAGTKLARTFFMEQSSSFPLKEVYNQKSCHPSRSIAGSGFRPLPMIPPCWLLKKPGPCLRPSVADHPLRPAKDLQLGKPLPYQLPNPTKAHLVATQSLLKLSGIHTTYKVSACLKAILIPVYKVDSHAFLTRSPRKTYFSFDLHVLSILLAFILSQDQTLSGNIKNIQIFYVV